MVSLPRTQFILSHRRDPGDSPRGQL